MCVPAWWKIISPSYSAKKKKTKQNKEHTKTVVKNEGMTASIYMEDVRSPHEVVSISSAWASNLLFSSSSECYWANMAKNQDFKSGGNILTM